MKKIICLVSIFVILLSLIFFNVACNSGITSSENAMDPTSTPISTLNPTPDLTITPTPTSTVTSTPSSTCTPTPISTVTPTPASTSNIKIMIMTRQHGNEPAGTSAIFSYISDLVNDTSQYIFNNSNIMTSSDVTSEISKIMLIQSSTLDIQVSSIGTSVDGKTLYCIKIQRPAGQTGNSLLPSGVTLLFIPMVNPDGADSSTRNNANDINLNRDWDDLSQPETQTVHGNVFDLYSPEVVLDMHEFTPAMDRPFNMTYCPGTKDETPNQTPTQLKNLYTAFETIVNQNLTNNNINYSITTTARTSIGWVEGDSVYGGNHFGIKYYAINYTIETKGIAGTPAPLPPLTERINMHRLFFQTMITYASDNKADITSIVSGLRTSN